MSTHINDLASAAVVFQAVVPSTRTGPFNGDAVDLISADGECFAIQQVGAFEEGPSWTGRFQESADGAAWVTISGAEFSAVTEGERVQVIRFRRTARYVRYTSTAAGPTPDLVLAVLVGEQRKTF